MEKTLPINHIAVNNALKSLFPPDKEYIRMHLVIEDFEQIYNCTVLDLLYESDAYIEFNSEYDFFLFLLKWS